MKKSMKFIFFFLILFSVNLASAQITIGGMNKNNNTIDISDTFTPLTFLQLTDTPSSYSIPGFCPTINSGGTALEFTNCTASVTEANLNVTNSIILAGESLTNWDNLTDVIQGIWNDSDTSVFYDTGNVGIGTNSPSAELTVVGEINTTDNITIYGPNKFFKQELANDQEGYMGWQVRPNGQSAFFHYLNAPHVVILEIDGTGHWQFSNTVTSINSQHNNYDFKMDSENNTNIFYADGSGGNFGFNTTAPDISSLVDVNGLMKVTELNVGSLNITQATIHNLFLDDTTEQNISSNGANILYLDAKRDIQALAEDFIATQNLWVGASTESIADTGFLVNGNDAYIEDKLGVNGIAYFDTAVNVDGTLNLDATGTSLTVDGDIHGDRETPVVLGKKVGSVDSYLDLISGLICTSSVCVEMPYDGSIRAISISYSNVCTAATCKVYARINGVNTIFASIPTLGSAGTDSTTVSRGTHTFNAGDTISCFFDESGNINTIQVDCAVEVQYDT